MTDDCINASIEIFTPALLTEAGCMSRTVNVRTGTQNRHLGLTQNATRRRKTSENVLGI